ncbi:hypothetical protein [Streptomyces caniscabiei]|uniref:DUF4034 domain-containing protein n=1 Tax=Streptomyces caniscabiei TaxID=2746961 RepID=A0ABU4MXH9_9ACTN|nr:hypothetical protein [Streptomyces caniscabiei]MBE4741435.1 hypothetical protein [Streptomyces caniscabiei]MBE4761591.1 hypothetical protein [Streptomyces caniscabiei]MBE4789997.1 hypothetical protein [Streptomyces caniscabiei]MBE4799240.1 hypothetical protein [Streptomyces caniscabiei]MDX2947659.1 hypothetical protein [Streptomyces caniscabiei]
MPLVYHPAGHDDALRVALEELEAGRWRTAKKLLLDTGTHWALRTSRTQMLAVAAARSDVVSVWLSEEPGSYDAQLMSARVAVERALRAHRQQHLHAWEFEAKARRESLLAANRAPYDPLPWVCLVTLAQIDTRQVRSEHRIVPAEPMLPHGPWSLLYEVNQRDPYNREAYHRVLQFLLDVEGPGGASLAAVFDFARWVASQRPVGSPLLLLPAYAQIEQRRRSRAEPLWRQQWAQDSTLGYTLSAFYEWFRKIPAELCSVADLSCLAYALWAGSQYLEAAEVFAAMGPYAAREPWASVHEGATGPDPGEALLLRARAESFSYARSHGQRAGPHP